MTISSISNFSLSFSYEFLAYEEFTRLPIDSFVLIELETPFVLVLLELELSFKWIVFTGEKKSEGKALLILRILLLLLELFLFWLAEKFLLVENWIFSEEDWTLSFSLLRVEVSEESK